MPDVEPVMMADLPASSRGLFAAVEGCGLCMGCFFSKIGAGGQGRAHINKPARLTGQGALRPAAFAPLRLGH
jgi:hypothetical protein